MSYTALYRKFRPTEFEDVKGQDHIVTTLKNQIKADRIGHAYLFCGTRGTGKTTIAKIFAKAVNCEQPVDGSPCGECSMCRAIAAGTSMNVVEIDAASNNGVDNIREIREEVAYSPTEGRFRVYIIDEVHMLSIGAFNALLKTLEEPPSYVIFILATTEAHKIPVTILSRCQRYDFKRISIDTIAGRLSELMEKEGVEVEERAVRYVAKTADGSMRDALSLLDQCIAFYMGKKLTYDNVLDVLGAVDTEVFGRFLQKIEQEDILGCIRSLEELIMQGRELTQFFTDFTWYLRNLLLIRSSDHMEEVLDVSTENLAQLKEDAKNLDADTLMRYIRIFSDLAGQLKYASQKRILAEMTLIRVCRPSMERNMDSIFDRLSRVERAIEDGAVIRQESGMVPGASGSISGIPDAGVKREEPPKLLVKAIPEEVQQAVADWKNIIRDLSGMTKNYLKHARLSLGGENRLQLVFEDEVAFDFVNRDAQKSELTAAIEKKIGKAVELEVRLLDRGRAFEDSFVDIEKIINMEITIED